MSKLLLGAILAVLVVLLGVMSWAVSPHPPQKPEPPKLTEAQAKAEREKKIKEQAEYMEKSAKGVIQKPLTQASPNPDQPAPNMPSKPSGKNSGPKGMVITGNWMRDRKPGAEGLKELEQKAKEDQAKMPPIPTMPQAK